MGAIGEDCAFLAQVELVSHVTVESFCYCRLNHVQNMNPYLNQQITTRTYVQLLIIWHEFKCHVLILTLILIYV